MKLSELLEVVYRHYPRGLLEGDALYFETEEGLRLRQAARRGAAEYPMWKAMMRRLAERYPIWDYSLYLLGGTWGPGYSGFIWIPGYRIGFHVSLLGPYYGIHRIGAHGEEAAALDLAREIEATYPGYEPIPPELGEEVVPEVLSRHGATIYECLLSEDWKGSSIPDNRERSPHYVDPSEVSEAEFEAPVSAAPDDEDEPKIHYYHTFN